MTRITLQFHAAPDEMASLLHTWLEGLDVDVTFERYFPEEFVDASSTAEFEEIWQNRERIDRVSFRIAAPDSSARAEHAGKGPDNMTLNVGQLNSEGLRESTLGAIAEDPASIKAWRRVRTRAKKSMHKGAWVKNPATGARASVSGHLYTDGAQQLAAQGVKMLAVAGWNEFELSGPSDER